MKKALFLFALLFFAIRVFAQKSFTHIDVAIEVQKSLGIKTEKARSQPWSEILELPGTVRPLPKNEHEIHSPVSGQVQAGLRIPGVGEQVKKGEILAVIRQTLTASEALQIKLQSIQAMGAAAEGRNNLSLKKKTYQRAKELFAIQALSLKDLQIAKTDYENARLEFQTAKKQVSFYKKISEYRDFPLASPIDGTIVSANIVSGETIDPQEQLLKVEDLSRVWVEIHVYENDIQKIYKGERVKINTPAFPGKTFYGKVSIIGMEINPNSLTLPAVIELKNPMSLLKEGMLAQARLLTPQKSSLAIPASSLVTENGRYWVFVKKEKTDFYRRFILLKKSWGERAFILKGIHPGDEVVTQGADLLNQEWHNRESGETGEGETNEGDEH